MVKCQLLCIVCIIYVLVIRLGLRLPSNRDWRWQVNSYCLIVFVHDETVLYELTSSKQNFNFIHGIMFKIDTCYGLAVN